MEVPACCSRLSPPTAADADAPLRRRRRGAASLTAIRLPNWCCSSLLVVLCCFVVGSYAADVPVDLSEIPTPPFFVHEPNDRHIYFVLDAASQDQEGKNSFELKEREFRCRARAYPPQIKYEWFKDGEAFNMSAASERVTQIPGEGTFIFSKLQPGDEGDYECRASNANGTAVDDVIGFTRTFINRFPPANPSVEAVQLGDSFTRSCTPPASVPPPRVYWILKGDTTRQGQFQTINQSHISTDDQGSIYFHYVNVEDKNSDFFYTCTVENKELKDYKFGNQFRLDVKTDKRKRLGPIPPVELYVSSPDVTALRGHSMTLYCFFSGYPLATPKWYKDEVEVDVSQNDRYLLPTFGKSFEITNVTKDDGGQYACRFATMAHLDRVFTVSVEAAPYWVDGPPPSQNASEGSRVEFSCGAIGSPQPKFTFYKNGKELKADKRYEVLGKQLYINSILPGKDGEGDNAVYQCKAENKHGYLWANFYLNVLSFAPILLSSSERVDAVIDSGVTLTCHFFGSPKPEVEWSGNTLTGSDAKGGGTDANGVSSLQLADVQKLHEGAYTCTAKNIYGEAEGVVSVVVREGTRIVKFNEADRTMVAGQAMRLPCQVKHDPSLRVNVFWKVGEQNLTESDFESGHYQLLDDNTLVIPQPNKYDSETYTCVAATSLDHKAQSVKVNIKDVPSPPSRGSVRCADRTAVISIDHLEPTTVASPVSEFWVQYQIDPDTDGNGWRTHDFPIRPPFGGDKVQGGIRQASPEITVDLSPYGKYQFRVIARNEVGDSSPLKMNQTCTTEARLPDRNPSEVYAKGNAPDNLVVYWQPMPREHWNGPDFHYVVRYRPEQTDDDDGAGGGGGGGDAGGDDDEDEEEEEEWQTAAVNDPYENHVVIDQLPGDYEPYEVQVQAVNQLGAARVSAGTERGHTGEGIPSTMVGNFRVGATSGSTATFLWDKVDADDVKGDFQGYKIVHWYEEDGATGGRRRRAAVAGVRQIQEFGADSDRGTVFGLKPNRLNKAQIYVFNGVNDGPPSPATPIEVMMPEGSPTPVRELNAYPLQHDIVGLRWDLPRESNGVIQQFHLSWCEVVDDGDAERLDDNNCPDVLVDGTRNHYRVTQLSARTKYRFIVAAETGGGVGDRNSVDARTLPLNVPMGQPSTPEIKELGVGEDHLNVTWVPGAFDADDPRPVGTDHYFKYRKQGTSAWKEERPVDGNFTVTIDGLEPGTTYQVIGVSVVTYENGTDDQSESPTYFYTTAGQAVYDARFWWFILIILLIVVLLIILCVVCLLARHRGAKYPVSEKEKEQGREPMLANEEKGFGEYTRPDAEEKRSLARESKGESETDSMAEYGENDAGRFTEDGSFIGAYVPNKMMVSAPNAADRSNVSTFV